MIAVVHLTSHVEVRQVQLWTYACAGQLRRHLAPFWGRTPDPVVWFDTVDDVPPGCGQVILFATEEQASSMGYENERLPTGHPFGAVYVDPILDDQASPSIRMSHQVMETSVDPYRNAFIQHPDGAFFPLRVCDPVAADDYVVTYQRQPVRVSNFVGPNWFNHKATRSDDLDFMNTAPQPFKVAKGGQVEHIHEGTSSG